jgi:hypothetical protein
MQKMKTHDSLIKDNHDFLYGRRYCWRSVHHSGHSDRWVCWSLLPTSRVKCELRLIFIGLSKICVINRMSTEHYKQMLGEAMRKVKRAEALIVRASRAESEAFNKQRSYNTALSVSMKAKNYLNNAYRSLNGVKKHITNSMKRSSIKKGGKRTHRKRTHRKRKHCTHRKHNTRRH